MAIAPPSLPSPPSKPPNKPHFVSLQNLDDNASTAGFLTEKPDPLPEAQKSSVPQPNYFIPQNEENSPPQSLKSIIFDVSEDTSSADKPKISRPYHAAPDEEFDPAIGFLNAMSTDEPSLPEPPPPRPLSPKFERAQQTFGRIEQSYMDIKSKPLQEGSRASVGILNLASGSHYIPPQHLRNSAPNYGKTTEFSPEPTSLSHSLKPLSLRGEFPLPAEPKPLSSTKPNYVSLQNLEDNAPTAGFLNVPEPKRDISLGKASGSGYVPVGGFLNHIFDPRNKNLKLTDSEGPVYVISYPTALPNFCEAFHSKQSFHVESRWITLTLCLNSFSNDL